jgi:hypothetical protein
VAILVASTLITTTPSFKITILYRIEIFTSAFTLRSTFVRFSIVKAADFALKVVQFSYFFNAFLASFSLSALVFFLTLSFALFSFSSLFLKAFAALLIFLSILASSLTNLSASFYS